MKLRFLGGAEEVGSLGMVLEVGTGRYLFDYGFTPTHPPAFPMEAPPIEAAFLTHSHIDHSGMMPSIGSKYHTKIHATKPTLDVASLLMEDSLKIWNAEGFANPYDEHDLRIAKKEFTSISHENTMDFGDIQVTPHTAGHIPGSTMFEVQADRELMFTGDINTINTRLVKGTSPVRTEVLVMESTYAGRNHPPRDKIEYEFLAKVEEVVDRGGLAIIPVFAVGRTQEILMVLRNQGYDLWLDGMGKKVNKLYIQHKHYLRNHKALRNAVNEAKEVYSPKGFRMALSGEVILTTSGMLDGGPVLSYINKVKDDPDSAILLTGYQVEGTNGRRLLESGSLEIKGALEKVQCEVGFFDFSAHSGHAQLLDFVNGCDPETVVLCHGDNREELAKDLDDRYEVILPKMGEELFL